MSARIPTSADADERPAVAIFRSPVFNPSETFVQAQAAALARYQPLMVGLEDKGNAGGALSGRIVLAAGVRERLAFTLGRPGALAERLRPWAPQIVHAHFGTDGLTALPLARALGVPLLTTLHGYDVSRSRARLLLSGRISWVRYALFQRRLMAQGILFLAVSDAVRRQAVARGYPEQRTITHYIGVDTNRFRPGDAAEPGLILHVGRLVEKKGTKFLLEAFAKLAKEAPGAQLVVLGDGPLRSSLEAQAAALGLGASVRFLGARPAAEVAGWMGKAWLLAAPSVTARDGDAEGLPTVLAEAAASGLPAVATRHAGNGEAVLDGQTGFLVPERDAAALAERLMQLIASPALRARMAASARALAEERFDLARQTAILEDHYDRLVER
ncbi:MAG TPA: glycosyltransferase [Allosphingosinicella sp.]|nr:glycosyltransferase [Allosphingosinicella sp.]